MRIFLIGMPGSGKSALGFRLASKLHFQYIDTDLYIEDAMKMPVNEIFRYFGEEKFRNEEHTLIQQLNGYKNAVFATGGGFACSDEHITKLNNLGITVYLKAKTELLVKRIKQNPYKRPMLIPYIENDLEIYLSNLLINRVKYYEKAQITVNADADIETVLNAVTANL
jgi:shikimate kinase